MYRYFAGIEEVLVEVVDNFTKFDKGILATVEAKDISHIDKVLEFLKMFGTYYDGYKEMTAIVLNYESFLHNVNTRDKIAGSIELRTNFVRKELKAAMEEGEIIDTFTPEELTNLFIGGTDRDLLNRRIQNDTKSHDQVIASMLDKLADMVRIKKDQ
jgi:hypothetical protein